MAASFDVSVERFTVSQQSITEDLKLATVQQTEARENQALYENGGTICLMLAKVNVSVDYVSVDYVCEQEPSLRALRWGMVRRAASDTIKPTPE